MTVIRLKSKPARPSRLERCTHELRNALTPLVLEYGVYTVITVAHEVICEVIEHTRQKHRANEDEWLKDLQARFERATRESTEAAAALPRRAWPRLYRGLLTVMILALCSVACAQGKHWYDVPAADLSLYDQLVAISQAYKTQLLFNGSEYDWEAPAAMNVHGWFTAQEAFCLALSGTPEIPELTVIAPDHETYAVHRMRPGQRPPCEYVTVDYGPEWIHPPRADWK